MTAAVIFLWASCLWAITRSILRFVLSASLWRQLLTLAVLALAVLCAHKPLPDGKAHN